MAHCEYANKDCENKVNGLCRADHCDEIKELFEKGIDKSEEKCYNNNTKLKKGQKEMAIKYYHLKDRGEVIAVLDGTRYEAVKRIAKTIANTKSICFDPDKYLMPTFFKAVAKCHPDDEWNPEIGEKVAKKKLMERYYKCLDKKIDAFVEDINLTMFEITQRF